MKSISEFLAEYEKKRADAQPSSNGGDVDKLEMTDQLQGLRHARYKLTIKQRSLLGLWTAMIVTMWIVWVLIIVAKNKEWANLSDGVLITLLTTTTLNVLGLPIIVLNSIFNEKQNV